MVSSDPNRAYPLATLVLLFCYRSGPNWNGFTIRRFFELAFSDKGTSELWRGGAGSLVDRDLRSVIGLAEQRTSVEHRLGHCLWFRFSIGGIFAANANAKPVAPRRVIFYAQA